MLVGGTALLASLPARALVSASPTSATAAHTLPAPSDHASAEMLLEVRLNGVLQDDVLRVLMLNGRAALAAADWKSLNLRQPVAPALLHAGQSYQPLDLLAGVRWSVDTASQALVIDAPPSAFAATRVGMDKAADALAPVDRWGGYANYDLAWQRNGSAGPGRQDWTRGLIDLGAFGPLGGGRSSALVRDDGTLPHVVRLDTTWTVDRPERMESLRIGDTIGKAGAWGQALRLGGVQWATDFSTQPGFLSFPLPTMRGEAALPSTLDVYVNNTKRATSSVPAGPFELNDLPIVTGSGQVRLVVRDLLGREQVIVQPYAMSPALLRTGLHAYSVEVGALREDYGLASDHYGRVMAAATDRLGVSDSFTRELRAEALGRQAALGATGVWQLGSFGVTSLSGVASQAPVGRGALLAATAERQDTDWNGSVQLRTASRGFTQIGQSVDGTPRLQASVAVGGVLANLALGASLVHQQAWSGATQRLLTFNVMRSVGAFGSVALFALRDLVNGSTTVALSLNLPLGTRSGLSVSTTSNRNREGDGWRHSSATAVQLQRNLPEDEGYGYTVDATTNHDRGLNQEASQRLTAQGTLQTQRAAFSAGLSQGRSRGVDGSTTTSTDARAGVSGGIAWLDHSVFMSRRIDGSFAVVEVGDYPDVQIERDHHAVARTDANGRALITGLRGYETNRIGIDAADLPFDAEVDALEVELTPPSRSGVVLRMPVRRNRSASLRLVDARGVALPPGSVVQIVGRSQTFPVGLDGRSFISGLLARTPIQASWPGGACRATLALELEAYASVDDLPELGTVTCR